MVGKVIYVGWWISIAVIVMFVVDIASRWVLGLGGHVVSCTERDTARYTPALSVQVYTERRGHVTEHHLLGCTIYKYVPPDE